MVKTLSSAAAAFALLAIAYAGAAKADCWWTGYAWTCNSVGETGMSAPPSWWGYGYGYPGYAPSYWPYPGYKPAWYPSLPGPRASSGAGR